MTKGDSVIQTRYGASYFIRWLFGQDRCWLTANGEWKFLNAPSDAWEYMDVSTDVPMTQMTDSHVLNTLLYLERTADDIYETLIEIDTFTAGEASEWLVNTPLYRAMKERLVPGSSDELLTIADDLFG